MVWYNYSPMLEFQRWLNTEINTCDCMCDVSAKLYNKYKGRRILEVTHHWRATMHSMMTSSNGNIFLVTGPLWWESTDDRWIPITKASDAELWCFVWSAPEQTVEQTLEMQVIWYAIAFIMARLWRPSGLCFVVTCCGLVPLIQIYMYSFVLRITSFDLGIVKLCRYQPQRK